MLKRICDKCGKEINLDADFWFQMMCNKMDENQIFDGAGVYELCDKCFKEFKEQLANNN